MHRGPASGGVSSLVRDASVIASRTRGLTPPARRGWCRITKMPSAPGQSPSCGSTAEPTAMTDPSLNTTRLHACLERMRSGDLDAREELVRSVCGRLEHLARKMLRAYPAVRRWEDTSDVLQSTLM